MIEGAVCSGKGVLAALFDSSKQVFSFPVFHDGFGDRLLESKYIAFAPWLYHQQISEFRRRNLNSTSYYMLECYSRDKVINFPIDSSSWHGVPLNFDFYKYDKEVFDTLALLKKEEFSPANICKIILSYLAKYITGGNNYKYLITQGHPGFTNYDLFFKKYPGAKVLYVRRPVIDTIYSWLYRRYNGNHKQIPKMINELVTSSGRFYNDIITYYKLPDIIKQYPKQFYIVDFENLIFNHKEEVDKICDFLSIDKEDILYKPTLLGNEITGILGVEKDNVTQLITSEEKALLEQQINKILSDKNEPNKIKLSRRLLACLIPNKKLRQKIRRG